MRRKLSLHRISVAGKSRLVAANAPEKNGAVAYLHNGVRTTKYTLLSFLPKNLMEQFKRAANIYFLVLSVLTALPISPKDPYSLVGTFFCVLLFTAMKEAYEDHQRWKSDMEINNREVEVIRERMYQKVLWKDVVVGDIVRVHKDQPMCADCVLLSSADTTYGICYVDTCNLDGETNLKTLVALTKTKHLALIDDLAAFSGVAECEKPSPSLYTFSSSMTLAPGGEVVPLSTSQLLLRGCVLRNTKFVHGLVVYTGHESKLMLNASEAPFKMSNVMHSMNKDLYMVFGLQALLCLMNTIAAVQWKSDVSDKIDYMGDTFKDDAGEMGLGYAPEAYLTFLVAYSNLIPISLYVGIEVIKLTQKYLVDNDLKMYHAASDTPALARTSNLIEELGQVRFVFSDKTGTLTCNQMEFIACSIGGESLGAIPEPASDAVQFFGSDRPGSPLGSLSRRSSTSVGPAGSTGGRSGGGDTVHKQDLGTNNAGAGAKVVPANASVDQLSMTDLSEHGGGQQRNAGSNPDEACSPFAGPDSRFSSRRSWEIMTGAAGRARDLHLEFWTLLAVCHTVVPEYPDDDPANREGVVYQASSPDEAALVLGAKHMGIFFHSRTPESVTITNSVLSCEQTFEVLNVLEFNSTRKRMSLIVRLPDGRIVLYCKGADSVILERLRAGAQPADVDQTVQHLKDYSEVGLRTLCLARRVLPDSLYAQWNTRFHAASVAIENREAQLDALAEEIEVELELLGATAIEDKLQDRVPETIETIRSAGIKLWVLTGDKEETAINIGCSCRLLAPGMKMHLLSQKAPTEASLSAAVQQALKEQRALPADTESAIVIDGATLAHALAPAVRDRFLELGLMCNVCICCRVSPKQKAEVVLLVKENLPVITLAIGDGANDVSMIQAAHLGIGISGQEGMQAVRSSDYAIAQFEYLERLLFVHGRWGYKRISKFVLYYFYKNIASVMTEFWFAWYCGFSGQIFFADWLSLSYNAVFTSYPCVVGFALEQDVSARAVLAYPRLYEEGMFGSAFNWRIFALWIALAIYHSIACFFMPMAIFSVPEEDGVAFGHWYVGTAAFTAVILVVTGKMALEVHSWNKYVKIITALSVAVYFVSVLILCAPAVATVFQPEMLGIITALMGRAKFWLAMPLVCVTALLPDLVMKYVQRTYWPKPCDIVAEKESLRKAAKRRRRRNVLPS